MASFKWQRIENPTFGTIFLPVAHVQIVSPTRVSRQLLLAVDTGAVVSLLARSAAELLKLDWESGREVSLTSVGRAKTKARVFELEVRFPARDAWAVVLRAPFAIAAREDVPNFLGRLGVLDTCQLLADATMAETTFLPRWLDDPAEVAIWRRFTHMSEDIVERWKSRQRPSHVKEAVGSLLNRAGQLMAGIVGAVQLHRQPAVNPLLRSLFELSLQFEYLMRDSDARATRFLQFRKVTRYRWMQKWKQHPESPISARLVRAGNERDHARVEQEFRQVESMFTSGRKSRMHDNWYGKKIRDLATELGRQAEYDLWYAVWSAWAHGDPFVVTVHDARHILRISYHWYGRMLSALGGDMVLTNEQHEWLKLLDGEFA